VGIESPNIGLLDDTKMEFHDHLKRLREAKDLTQAQVAESVDIAKNTYIGYEKGSREPRLSELKKLAELFQVELGELCLESQGSGLSGWLKMALKRAEGLKARQKAALLEIVQGYISNCEVSRISGEGEWLQQIEEDEMDELLRQELEVEHYEKQEEDRKRFNSNRS
jgi:transcriptional regulator with XRE-family HTH domain